MRDLESECLAYHSQANSSRALLERAKDIQEETLATSAAAIAKLHDEVGRLRDELAASHDEFATSRDVAEGLREELATQRSVSDEIMISHRLDADAKLDKATRQVTDAL